MTILSNTAVPKYYGMFRDAVAAMMDAYVAYKANKDAFE